MENKETKRKSMQVIDLATGVIYESVKEAAADTGLDPSTVYYNIGRPGRWTRSGHNFAEYIEEVKADEEQCSSDSAQNEQ